MAGGGNDADHRQAPASTGFEPPEAGRGAARRSARDTLGAVGPGDSRSTAEPSLAFSSAVGFHVDVATDPGAVKPVDRTLEIHPLIGRAASAREPGVIYAVASDITERVRLEADLEQSRRDVEDFMENANVPLHSVDAGAQTGHVPAGGGP